MIYFTTVAYREPYVQQSLKMIESIREFCPEAKIAVVTDLPERYDGLGVMVHEGPKCEYKPWFKANYKSYAFEPLLGLVQPDDIVIFLDCDCYLVKTVSEQAYSRIPYGLSVALGKGGQSQVLPEDVQNPVVREKILGINPDSSQLYYVFREAFLAFKVDDSFPKFVEAWKAICGEIDHKQLNHANVTFDIQNAALRAQMPIYNISDADHLWRSVLTETVDGGTSIMV